LYYYCNPKDQIKNRLKHNNVQNIENEYQKIIQKTQFKFSNGRYAVIYRKKETLLIKIFCYSAITVIVMILILLFVDSGYPILNIILYAVTIFMGVFILYVIPTDGYKIYTALKQLISLPYNNFEVCKDGIRATTYSGDVWIPFEDDLIINPYDCKERLYRSFYHIYDGIEFKKFNEKKVKFRVGPVEDYEFFYLITLYHYVNWLNEHELLLSEEYVKEHYFLSDPFKKAIAEKIMMKEEGGKFVEVPTILDLPTFSIESDKAVFRYPKTLYRRYIQDDEKVYLIHRQETTPTVIRRRFIIQIICFCFFGAMSALLFTYLQQENPDEMYLIIFPLIPIFFIAFHFSITLILLKRIKNVEVIFTESKILIKRKDWVYPLSYDEILSVDRINEKGEKGYYKFLHFHAREKRYLITLYDIWYDNPILKILDTKKQDN
jgi:hypothetical protein